jgi:hypothetical protein
VARAAQNEIAVCLQYHAYDAGIATSAGPLHPKPYGIHHTPYTIPPLHNTPYHLCTIHNTTYAQTTLRRLEPQSKQVSFNLRTSNLHLEPQNTKTLNLPFPVPKNLNLEIRRGGRIN